MDKTKGATMTETIQTNNELMAEFLQLSGYVADLQDAADQLKTFDFTAKVVGISPNVLQDVAAYLDARRGDILAQIDGPLT